MTLKYTIDQVRDRQVAKIGVRGIPNAWWPARVGNDCIKFQLERMGVARRNQQDSHFISISAFRLWAGWENLSVSELRPGDIALWSWSGGDVPEHAEGVYSIDHGVGRITTISANTGPVPGQMLPRGVWRKTRPISGALLGGIRPPYKSAAATISPRRRKQVKLTAAYLNKHRGSAPETPSVKDGVPGPKYWTLVQRWGREHHLYGPGFHIDGVPGPRTRTVEAQVFKAAKKAAK